MKMKALKAIKDKVKTLNNKCHELTDEVLAQVTGGAPTIRVKEDDVAVLNTTTASDALQGKVPGVGIAEQAGKPGSKSEIMVR